MTLYSAFVVSYWISTSNHNDYVIQKKLAELYLIEILHQTTTLSRLALVDSCCILLKFYIKPQLFPRVYVYVNVVSY